MAGNDRSLRIVQWTTGKVARESITAILERPDLELVGVYAFSREKVGQDVGDLARLGRTIGITATDDIDATARLAAGLRRVHGAAPGRRSPGQAAA